MDLVLYAYVSLFFFLCKRRPPRSTRPDPPFPATTPFRCSVFIPAGPMTPGIPNKLKAEVRERYAAGEATREELLEAEASSYHAPGTCTFYGTANSNQVLLEAMGVQLPGASFVNPGTPLRD